MGRVGGKVGQLIGIGVQVKELLIVHGAVGVFPAALPQRHHRRDAALGGVFHAHGLAARGAGADRAQALALCPGHDAAHVHAGKVAKRRADVDGRDRFGHQPRLQTGSAEHHRHTRGAFEEAHLEPQAALSQHIAVVGDEQHDRLLPRDLQHVQDVSHLLVEIGDVGEIRAARPGDVLRANVEGAPVVGVEETLRMGVLIVIGDRRDARLQVFAALVEIPEPAARDIGVVRVGEADGEHPGPGVVAAGEVVELGGGVMGDLVVVFHLVGDLCHTRAGDGAEVVVPPVDPLARFAVIRGPAEVGGVDVRGQALLEAVKLVGADEMHLAAERGLVAGAAQVVGVGRQGRGEFGRIVVDAGGGRQPPGHEGPACRRAERRGGVAIAEPDRPGGQTLQVRCVQERGGPVGKERSVQLVDHQDEDVGRCRAVAHSGAPISLSRAASTWARAAVALVSASSAAWR